ncbi:MAG: RdgB/HAM1 family non-canonical purine NTP pyrophosphatase [Endomicrobium sp.]|nr:RdgB/HAM1 family non-canonical purine NTP pyrophosphatase [Endomicrobium sp.]
MIKEIIIATCNTHKADEIKAILEDLDIKTVQMTLLPKCPETVEDGKTLEENATKKAIAASKFFGKWAIADDTGLEVDCLKGAPGVYSARYAGQHCSFADNNKKLLAALGGVPMEKRTAKFRTVVAISSPRCETYLVSGEIFGTIAPRSAGANGFGYDSIFCVPEYGKTFSELGAKVKNYISHRAIALKRAKKIIENLRIVGK